MHVICMGRIVDHFSVHFAHSGPRMLRVCGNTLLITTVIHQLNTVVVPLGTSRRAALQCPVCPRMFVSKANLLVHAKNEHGDDRGPFNCSICGRIAKNKNSLRVHVYLYHRKN